jgi:hypothetical protein
MTGWQWPLFWLSVISGVVLLIIGHWPKRKHDPWRMPNRVRLQAPRDTERTPSWDVHKSVFCRRQGE